MQRVLRWKGNRGEMVPPHGCSIGLTSQHRSPRSRSVNSLGSSSQGAVNNTVHITHHAHYDSFQPPERGLE